MADQSAHPSFLELDRLALGLGDDKSRKHVAICEACDAHLRRLAQAESLPASLGELAAHPAPEPWWRRLLRPSWLVPAAMATCAILLLLPTSQVAPVPAGANGVRAKGTPTFALYVKSAGSVRLWDGSSPIHPGDSLRLKLVPAGFGFVTVASPGVSPTVLYQAPVYPDAEELLPFSFRADEQPGPERLVILFSHEALSDAELRSMLTTPVRDQRGWTISLEIPTEVPQP